jgi:hypothetical protein
MTKQTTAQMTIGPLATGAFGDVQPWRISSQSQLVEGSVPYWLVTPTQPAEHTVTNEAVFIELPDAEFVVHSVLMVAAAWHGGESLLGYLIDTENILMDGDKRAIAPYWELADQTVKQIVQKLALQVKLGFTIMDEMSLINEEVIATLRSLGFHVDVFERQRELTTAL